MKNSNYKIAYEKSKYISVFNVEALDANYSDEIIRGLNGICYGDGNFYLRKYGDKICRIEFETNEESYVEEGFAKRHAEEICNALEKLARQYKNIDTLRG
jgi:hypothetical protein